MNRKNIYKWLFAAIACLLTAMPAQAADLYTDGDEQPEVVGTLTAYYAKMNFRTNGRSYKKGQLICDSNDPINRIVGLNKTSYKYEGDDTGEYYKYIIPRARVEKRTYTMNQLPTSSIGNRAVFVAKDGKKAQIFLSKRNGHKYFSWDPDNGTYEDTAEEQRHNQCYVLSAELTSFDGGTWLFEEQLEETDGHFDLYFKNRFSDGNDPKDCRYRKGLIGILEEAWTNEDVYDQSHYDANGNLTVDQQTTDGSIAEYISIAYIANLDALYLQGKLYYRK